MVLRNFWPSMAPFQPVSTRISLYPQISTLPLNLLFALISVGFDVGDFDCQCLLFHSATAIAFASSFQDFLANMYRVLYQREYTLKFRCFVVIP